MKAHRLAAVLALLALAGVGARGHRGRRLMQDQCSDFSLLFAELPEATDFLKVMAVLGVFKGGIPEGTTLFLPNNAAAAALPEDLELPFKLDTVLDALPALGPELKRRLISTALYHVTTAGALEPEALTSEQDLPTALDSAALMVTTNDPAAPFVVTDASGRRARPLAGPAKGALAACGAAVYLVDKVLLPGAELWEVPKTSFKEAVSALALAARPGAPAPAPAPAA